MCRAVSRYASCCAVLCPAGGEAGGDKLSKKQRKLLNRLKIAELKQQCLRPDVVEVWDVTAQDPQTLVTIKVRS
jgi:splicing factor 3B subunit 2